MNEPPDPTQRDVLALTGMLAGGVAADLSRPMRELREMLAVIVDELDHHVATARGPTPFSWKQLGQMRDRVAEAYLLSRQVARLAGDLAAATGSSPGVSAVDVNKTLEAALNLARHRLAEGTEIFVDLGAVPAVRIVPAQLLLALAHLIVCAADGARAVRDGAVRLSSRREGDHVVVRVCENGQATPEEVIAVVADAQRMVEPGSATVEGCVGQDQGGTYAIRIPIGHNA
jgi:signal transduction histidine kinase